MKILVTGANGQLGYDVVKELIHKGIDCVGVGKREFDITDSGAVETFLTECHPDAVIHCAAYTAVDRAEDEPELCRKVNAEGTGNIAAVCRKIDAKMIYISTDYVFPGLGTDDYEADDETGPLGVYGRTKLEGELAVKENLEQYFIIRISWVFGINGNNFIKTMLQLSEINDEINVVADQFGSPTYTADLAPLLCEMALSEKYGTYHATNEGVCNWSELAEEVLRQTNRQTKVNHITTDQFPSRALRPHNSRLSKRSLDESGFARLPEWQDAVGRYLRELINSHHVGKHMLV